MPSKILLLTFLTFAEILHAQLVVINPANSDWKYLKGVSEASSPDPTAWRGFEFDDSTWVTGQAMVVDGGLLAGRPWRKLSPWITERREIRLYKP